MAAIGSIGIEAEPSAVLLRSRYNFLVSSFTRELKAEYMKIHEICLWYVKA
jgi:hypothetical protein